MNSQEMADAIRAMAATVNEHSQPVAPKRLFGLEISAKDKKSLRTGLYLLASLIDPTCTDVGAGAYEFECSQCGEIIVWSSDTAYLPSYCHNCGARIVRDK